MTDQAYPLSSLQLRRLELAKRQNATSYSPVLQCLYTWPMAIDEQAINLAFQELLSRHESLRTSLVEITDIDQPLQRISNNAELSIHFEQEEKKVQFQKLTEKSTTPLTTSFNVTFWQTPDVPLLSIQADPVFIDRASIDQIVVEVVALLHKNSQSLDADPVQYIDFIDWQTELIEEQSNNSTGKNTDDASNNRLSIEYIDLNIEQSNTETEHTEDINVVEVTGIHSHQLEQLQSIASRYSVSLETLLFCNWQILLTQMSDGQPVSIGWHSTGRNQELEGAIGVFECHLPTSTSTSATTVVDLILANEKQRQQQLQQQFNLNFALQSDLPWLFEWLPKKDISVEQAPIFLDGARLKLQVIQQAECLVVNIAYNQNLYGEESTAYLAERFKEILSAWISQTDVTLDKLLTTETQNSLQFGKETNLTKNTVDWFERHAKQSPHAPAIHFRDNSLSYSELDQQANKLANVLINSGVGNGSTIGIYAQRSCEMIISILAVLKTGSAYVALDPNYPEERLAHIIDNAGLHKIVVCEVECPVFLDDKGRTLHLSELQKQLAASSASSPAVSIHPQQQAYILYTSGSTGLPKGVSVSHANLASSTHARMDFYSQSPTCFLLLSSFAFDSSIAGIFWTLSNGGALCLPEPSEELNVVGLAALMRTHDVSHLLCLPALYRAMLEQGITKGIASLRSVIVAGEACPPPLVAKHHLSTRNILLTNEYGPTEATVWCSGYSFEQEDSNIPYVPIGHAIENANLYVLDQYLQPVAKGVSGELYVGGHGVAQGYFQQSRLSAERLLPDPFSKRLGSMMYRSGDRVRLGLDDELEFLGRTDHQVKIRGYRIELTEIERQLMTHPQIQTCAVTVVSAGEDAKQLVAIIEGTTLPEQEALRHLEQRLPRYMMPTHWLMLDQLPTNANGKIDRKQLAVLFKEYMETAGGSQRAEYEAPKTEAEIMLCGICSELMNIENIGTRDDFFLLGGDSILSLQVVARAAKQGFALTPQELFENPVLADAAAIATPCDPVLDSEPEQQPSVNKTEPHIDIDLSDGEFDDLLAEIE